MKKLTFLFAILLAAGLNNGQAQGIWKATGSINTPRYEHTATLLNNGKVLVVGGSNGSTALASAELYDPATGTWTFTGSMNSGRAWHTATLLPNGKVLVAGGQPTTGNVYSTTELFDPNTGIWSPTGSMKVARQDHHAILLSNGKVLVTGGLDPNYVSQTTAELYDPGTGLWTKTGDMVIGRYWEAELPATLPDGSILIVGGWNCCPYNTINEAEVYHTSSRTWSVTSTKTTNANYAPVMLNNGKVLVAGGATGTQPSTLSVATSELFDPVSGTWTVTASMSTKRNGHTLTVLQDGNVLAAGGASGGWGFCEMASPNAELYDPATGKWISTGSMTTVRNVHTATMLPNGQVLAVGGNNCESNALSSAELYTPGNPQNTSYGTNALSSNSSGLYNSAFGYYSLYKSTTGNNNSAFGYHSLYSNKSGSSNIAFGSQALYSNTNGTENTALGTFALLKNTTGTQNTANGTNALYANTIGNYNTASGASALTSNKTGSSNTASGFSALSSNTTGNANTATGYFALIANTTGIGNTATGWSALSNNSTGKYNTALGNNANTSIGNLTNSTALGRGSLITASNQVRIGNSSVTSIGGYTGWSNISDGRYKQNLKEDVPGLRFINALRPVTYNLKITELDDFLRRDIRVTGKNDKSLSQQAEMDRNATAEKERIIYTGFVAQEVEKAAKEIGYDFSGVDAPKNDHDVYALRYAEFVVPLVKAVQQLSQKNDQLKNEIAAIKKMLQQRKNDASTPQTNGALEKLSVTVSPNPVRSVLHVSIRGNCISPVITALDMYGKVLLRAPVTGNQRDLDVSKLAAGAYMIKITDADGRQLYSGKFIKQN